jgi:hypothetical protein
MTNPEGQRAKRPIGPRPLPVTIAVWLNVVALVAGGIIAGVSSFSVTQPAGAHQVSPWLILAFYLVVLALMSGLLAALAFGRRWAWWLWLVMSVLGLTTLWSDLQHALEQGGLAAARFVLFSTLNVIALVLLLLPSSREWYRIGRRFREPSPPITSDEYDYRNWP